ncbi:hypothetical protein [Streptomyces sp. NPDC006551]|uniref:hypothetical protein n=1 Tax=Streptomyces sp. NPDC006551 TaxID=3157178 RepID=UPI0033AA9F56
MAGRSLYLIPIAVTVLAAAYCVWESVHHRRCTARHRAAQRLTDAAQQRDITAFRAQLTSYENARAVLDEAAQVVDVHLATLTNPQEGGPQ